MTRSDGNTVSLSASNWAIVALMVLGSLGGQLLLTGSRIAMLEERSAQQERHLDATDLRAGENQKQILEQIERLRQEIENKK